MFHITQKPASRIYTELDICQPPTHNKGRVIVVFILLRLLTMKSQITQTLCNALLKNMAISRIFLTKALCLKV